MCSLQVGQGLRALSPDEARRTKRDIKQSTPEPKNLGIGKKKKKIIKVAQGNTPTDEEYNGK